jgi:hypothetical protein
MQTIAPAVHAALERLIDYAGLFPPAQLTMPAAVAGYARAQMREERWVLGRFIVPAARLRELRAAHAGAPIELSVIAAPEQFAMVAAERAEGWGRVGAIEVPLGTHQLEEVAAAAEAAGFRDVPLYVEGTEDFEALAELGLCGKLRCGGLDPSFYPSPRLVGAYIARAAAAGVPFKATAGLHHPIRHYNEAASVTMHGFLNLLAAAAIAPAASPEAMEEVIGEENPAVVLAHLSDPAAAAAARARFVGYGSCSFEEPIEDLHQLALLHAAY